MICFICEEEIKGGQLYKSYHLDCESNPEKRISELKNRIAQVEEKTKKLEGLIYTELTDG